MSEMFSEEMQKAAVIIEQECKDIDEGGKQLHFPNFDRKALGILLEHEAAAILGVEVQTLAKWRRAGAGPRYSKPGKTVYYQEKHIIEWLDAHAMPLQIDVPGLEIPQAA